MLANICIYLSIPLIIIIVIATVLHLNPLVIGCCNMFQTADASVSAVETLLDYSFKDKNLLLQALQLSNDTLKLKECLQEIAKNDRLVVYGTTVLREVKCRAWFQSGQDKGEITRDDEVIPLMFLEEKWTTADQEIFDKKKLADKAKAKGLHDLFFRQNGTAEASDKMTASVVVALVGAASVDGGEVTASKVIEAFLG